MTDGTMGKDNTTYEELVAYIDENMQKNLSGHRLRIISFVYGKVENINYDIVKKITCKYNGIVFQMQKNMDKRDMMEKLSNYYTFLADGSDNTKAVWSQPYEDTSGFGTVISISQAVKYTDRDGTQKVLGVVGMDLQMSFLVKYADSYEEVVQNLQE